LAPASGPPKLSLDGAPAASSTLSGKESAAGEVVPNLNQRRDGYANGSDEQREDRVA
jgi:hypothetical protein